MNTTKIVNDYKGNIQREIDMKQEILNNINLSMKEAEVFLLDNGYDEIVEDADILLNVMDKLVELENDIVVFDKDIKSINESVRTLMGVSKGIDEVVANSLKNKIEEIEFDIRVSKEKISSANKFLPAILNLQIVCPTCNGATHVNKKACDYCGGVGVVGIDKIIKNGKNTKSESNENDFNKFRIQRTT